MSIEGSEKNWVRAQRAVPLHYQNGYFFLPRIGFFAALIFLVEAVFCLLGVGFFAILIFLADIFFVWIGTDD